MFFFFKKVIKMLSSYNFLSHGASGNVREELRYNILVAAATCDVNLLRECKF